eukprot:6172088-Pleurochrysis_carterae.AAC.5
MLVPDLVASFLVLYQPDLATSRPMRRLAAQPRCVVWQHNPDASFGSTAEASWRLVDACLALPEASRLLAVHAGRSRCGLPAWRLCALARLLSSSLDLVWRWGLGAMKASICEQETDRGQLYCRSWQPELDAET